ncbi:MAG: acyl-CoA thioesterase [Sphingobacteriaceae bacterium]|jgi:acyl-CoA thioester hydrolase|nr:acyl-CoA thioesterase [Sphingobacteriaceae bacterium]
MTQLPDLSTFNFRTTIPVRFADLDSFGKVYDAVYLTYFEIARSKYLKEVVKWDWESIGVMIGKSEINYIKPIQNGDELNAYVRTSRTGNSSFDLDYVLAIKTLDGEIVCTTGRTVCIAYNFQEKHPEPIPFYQLEKMTKFEMLANSHDASAA